MRTEHPLDRLARSLAASRSRREALRQLGGLLLGALASGTARSAFAGDTPGLSCDGVTCTFTGQVCVDGACVCPENTTLCEGACRTANFFKDRRRNCGVCDNVCPGDSNCRDGRCGGSGNPCPDGQFSCFGVCVNFDTDEQNCGQCRQVCPAGSTCQQGQCVCPAGQGLCPDGCHNLQTDEQNCGVCGRDCGSGGVCNNGACVCIPGLTACPNGCKDLRADSRNCGRCGGRCLKVGQICQNGLCCGPAASHRNCKGRCINITTDRNNCGRCGNRCPTGASCVNGACVCRIGQVICGSQCCPSARCCGDVCCGPSETCCGGTCARTAFSNQHCGACNNACGANEVCVSGDCACRPGFTRCGGVCRRLSSDDNNCGACGRTCKAGESCENGRCVSCICPKLFCEFCPEGSTCGFCGGGLACPCSCQKDCPSGTFCNSKGECVDAATNE